MILNVLAIGFVSVYCVLVIIGHVLLARALWPELFRKRRNPVGNVVKALDPGQAKTPEPAGEWPRLAA
jgi:hypothetical protein